MPGSYAHRTDIRRQQLLLSWGGKCLAALVLTMCFAAAGPAQDTATIVGTVLDSSRCCQ
jgi:hypothetical protein